VKAVLASRVARLGATIHRSPSRHYLGRAFATLAALTLDAAVYDTQCGAKWFRVNDMTRAAFADPFTTRWAFDVELLGRLLGRFPVTRPASPISVDDILEVPVRAWRDVKGSKLKPLDMARALGELARLAARSRRRPR
jgi:dolichyl-phosphate beta-glucosyltransferase